VIEDPATGAAAAAFGGYLRELRLIAPPARVTNHEGHDLGRPSLLLVDVDAGRPESLWTQTRSNPDTITLLCMHGSPCDNPIPVRP
jgi:predicted PhzF superfamily epimerase YddE/YHI9